MDFINSKAKQASKASFVHTVRGWIEDFIRLRTDLETPITTTTTTKTAEDSDSDSDSDDGLFGYTVLVQEMTCTLPGCAPIETVVALLKRNANHNGKIFKPIAEVILDDAKLLVGKMFGDAEPEEKDRMHSAEGGDTSSSSSGEGKSSTPAMVTDNDPHPFLCPCCNPEVTKFDKMLMFGPGLDHI
jgi:hypothetical protein